MNSVSDTGNLLKQVQTSQGNVFPTRFSYQAANEFADRKLLINVYDEGQAYTESEYRGWLEDAGFVDFEINYSSQGDAIMRARKP